MWEKHTCENGLRHREDAIGQPAPWLCWPCTGKCLTHWRYRGKGRGMKGESTGKGRGREGWGRRVRLERRGCWGRECWSVPWSCNTWWRGGKRDTEGDRWARVRTGKEKKAISKNEQERGEIRAGREENFRKGRCMQGELQKCCSCCKEPQLLTAWTLLSACLPEWWSAVLQWRLYQSGCTTTGLYIVMSLLCILVHQLDVPHVEEVADGCSVL